MALRPFIEPNEFLETLGFEITTLDLDETSDGWLRVHARWDLKDSAAVKYPHLGCQTSCWDQKYVELTFPELGKEKDEEFHYETDLARLEVGIETPGEKLDWSFKFKENIKYGVNLYFAPPNWNCGPDKPISHWQREQYCFEKLFLRSFR